MTITYRTCVVDLDNETPMGLAQRWKVEHRCIACHQSVGSAQLSSSSMPANPNRRWSPTPDLHSTQPHPPAQHLGNFGDRVWGTFGDPYHCDVMLLPRVLRMVDCGCQFLDLLNQPGGRCLPQTSGLGSSGRGADDPVRFPLSTETVKDTRLFDVALITSATQVPALRSTREVPSLWARKTCTSLPMTREATIVSAAQPLRQSNHA